MSCSDPGAQTFIMNTGAPGCTHVNTWMMESYMGGKHLIERHCTNCPYESRTTITGVALE